MLAAGFGKGSLDTSMVELTTSIALDFNLPSNAWRNMGTILSTRVNELGLAEATEDKTALAYRIANIAGDRFGKEYEKQNQTKKVPVFNVVSKLARSLFISEVKLAWHAQQKSWYSVGKIGISHIQGTQVNGFMDGMLEIRYSDVNPVVSLYLEPSSDGWYFLNYDETKRLSMLSASDDFNLAVESKSKAGKEGTYYFTLAESYEKKRFIKNFRKNYLGIDDGGIVEEPEQTRDKDREEENSEDSEEPKPKKKKKKSEEDNEEEQGDDEAPAKKKNTNEEEESSDEDAPSKKQKNTDDEGFGDEEKPAKEASAGEGESDNDDDSESSKKKKKKKKNEDDENTEEPPADDEDGFGGTSKPAAEKTGEQEEKPSEPSSDNKAPADSSNSEKKEPVKEKKEKPAGEGSDGEKDPASEGDKKKEEDDGF
jgi:hypothetical protein